MNAFAGRGILSALDKALADLLLADCTTEFESVIVLDAEAAGVLAVDATVETSLL